MTLTIDFSPAEQARIDAAASQTGANPADIVKTLITGHLPPPQPVPSADPENAASIALLQSWLQEDATDDPNDIREAEEELKEFKQNINAARARAGARLLFP